MIALRRARGLALVVLALAVAIASLGAPASAVAAAPSTPTITEPSSDGQLVHPADVHMEAQGFSDPDGDSHACSDWEIRDAAGSEVLWSAPCAGGLQKVHIHLGDGAFVNSYAGRTEFEYDTDYLLRVRFQDSNGDSGPYAQRAFRTYPSSGPGGARGWTPLQPGYRVETVTDDLQLPLGIAFAPRARGPRSDPLLYVTELYGTVKVLTRGGAVHDYATGLLNFDPLGPFPGSGEQGITGIAVDPSSGDVFVSVLHDPGGPHYPQVVRLHSTDRGLTASSRKVILDMPGEIQGESHQISDLTVGPDHKLYVHNGDGFDVPRALDLDSFRGKILRVNLDGSAPSDNPFYDATDGISARDYVYAYGFRNPFGGAWRAANGSHYEVENGPSVDRFARVDRGASYGWDGTDASMATGALYNWSPAHAPINLAFVQRPTFLGSGFPPEQMDHAFVTESGATWASGPQVIGKRVVEFAPGPSGELGGHPHVLLEYTGTGKSTAAGLAAGPDGLYMTELYKQYDYSSASDPGARLLRIRYVGTYPGCHLGGRALRIQVPRNRRARIVRGADGSIEVNGHPCGATAINIDHIGIRGGAGSETVVLDLRGGALGPGRTPERTGADEIEALVSLGRGRGDTLVLKRKPGAPPAARTRRGLRLNGDGDADVHLRGVERVLKKG